MKLKAALAYSLTAAIAIAVTVRYFLAVQSGVRAEQGSACSALQPQAVGEQAPAFELADLGGKKQRLAAHRGKVVLLNFWATWCPPCVEELPSLVALRRALEGKDFAVLTVSVDDSAAIVKSFFAKHKRPLGREDRDPAALPVLMDPGKKVSASYGTEKFPETYLVDRDGVARLKFVYKRDWSSPAALACIRSLLR
jgi:peroxiredoxin